MFFSYLVFFLFFFQAGDGIRGFCLFRWLGDVYKGQILGGGTFAFDDQLPVFQRPIEGILEQYKQYGAGKRKKRSGLRLMVNELSEKMSADDDNKAAKRVVASCIKSGDREFEPVQKQL